MKDIDLLLRASPNNINGKTLCAFGDAAATPVLTTLKWFKPEFEAHVKRRATAPAAGRLAREAAGGGALDAACSMILTPQLVVYVAVVLIVFIALQIVGGGDGLRRAQGRGVHAAALRPVPGRAARPAAADRRHRQAGVQGRTAAEGGRQVAVHAAPVISVVAAFAAFAPVPFGAATTFFGLLDEPMPLRWRTSTSRCWSIFAVTSMGVYGIVLAGWAQQQQVLAARRPAQLGADDQLRAVLRHGAGDVVICWPDSMSLREIVDAQSGYWFGFIPKWYVFLQPVGFIDLRHRRHRRDQPRAVRFP